MNTKLLIFLTLTFAFILSDARAGSATWKSNPATGDWNTAANWTPMTVPNGPADTATFETSNTTSIALSTATEVNTVAFQPRASAYTITPSLGHNTPRVFTISGAGITNNSGVTQNFVTSANLNDRSEIDFRNSATAGSDTVITNNGNPVRGYSASFTGFYDSSSAGSATLVNNGSPGNESGGGATFFNDNATADHATINNVSVANGAPGYVYFVDTSTAGDATFINDGSILFQDASTAANAVFMNGPVGSIDFYSTGAPGTSTFMTNGGKPGFYGSVIHLSGDGDHATFSLEGGTVATAGGAVLQIEGGTANSINVTINPATVRGALGGTANFEGTSRGGNSIFTVNGSDVKGAGPGTLYFLEYPIGPGTVNAEHATLIANGGTNGGDGGDIEFQGDSNGGSARVEIFGNARLNVAKRTEHPEVYLGSIEGDGLVLLGASTLILGRNNLSTTFSGAIHDRYPGGSLEKTGKGTLNLSGSNIYTGTTTVSDGGLAVTNTRGSATGSGPMNLNAGTLSGNGIIAGSVTVGTGSGFGAFLAPAVGSKLSHLTLQSALTLKEDATYICAFKANDSGLRTDEVTANGVTITGSRFSFRGQTQVTLTAGTTVTVIDNLGPTPISGTFRNLPDGGTITVGNNTFQANYEGGDGNDLTLTVVQ